MEVRLLSYNPDPEKLIEYCARISYDSVGKISPDSHKAFLGVLLKNGHLSVFEHAAATFYIDGISRACSHQLVRQRLASYTQKSQRYVNETDFSYVIPPSVKGNPEALELFEETMVRIREGYQVLVDLGVLKEDARFLLPNAADTTITMTANFREWLHVIDLRVSRHAQWEIRDMCVLIWKELYRTAPEVFSLTYFQHWSKDLEYKKEIFEKEIRHSSGQ